MEVKKDIFFLVEIPQTFSQELESGVKNEDSKMKA